MPSVVVSVIIMVSIFLSYSHHDEELRNELEIALSGLKREGLVEVWHDRRILAGEEFDNTISANLESADIILLLVSSYFIASDYAFGNEMGRALERHEHGEARVIPVILRPCDWETAPFGKLLALPPDGRPVTKYPDFHEALTDVSKGLRRVIEDLAPARVPERTDNMLEDTTPRVSAVEKGQLESVAVTRSSNLRVKRTFSDEDRDQFIDQSFEYVANFFENSLAEVQNRNPGLTTRFKRLSPQRFSATVYKSGEIARQCTIWQGSRSSFADGLAYVTGETTAENSYNEVLTVKDDGYTLFFQALGIGFHRADKKEKLSQSGAAEFLWGMFLDPLQ